MMKCCKDCNLPQELEASFRFLKHRNNYCNSCNNCVRARQLLYRQNNRWRYNESSKKWAKRNPEAGRVASKNRKALKRNAKGTFKTNERISLKDHFNYTCLMCGKSEPEIKLTVDHVLPLSKGGSNSIENIQPLCHSCNSSKKARYLDFRLTTKIK